MCNKNGDCSRPGFVGVFYRFPTDRTAQHFGFGAFSGHQRFFQQGQLRYAHDWRYQTDRTEITFNRADTSYALFDYTEEARRSAGVHVTLPDGTEHEVMCVGPITSNLNALQKSLHCDTDNALNGGTCP